MNPWRRLITLVVAFGGLSFAVWLGRYSRWALPLPTSSPEPVPKRAVKPKLAEAEQKDTLGEGLQPKPPFAKAVVAEREYDFGTMRINETRSHSFRIENKGEGHLLLVRPPTTCSRQPTWTREIPPGGFLDFEMHWSLPVESPTFAKTNSVETNDPKLPEIQFKVFGKVTK